MVLQNLLLTWSFVQGSSSTCEVGVDGPRAVPGIFLGWTGSPERGLVVPSGHSTEDSPQHVSHPDLGHSGLKTCSAEEGRPSLPWALRSMRRCPATSMNKGQHDGSQPLHSASFGGFASISSGSITPKPWATPISISLAGSTTRSAAAVARDLLGNRREDITLVLYLDDRHRLAGHAVG